MFWLNEDKSTTTKKEENITCSRNDITKFGERKKLYFYNFRNNFFWKADIEKS